MAKHTATLSRRPNYIPWEQERRIHLFDAIKVLMFASALLLVVAKLVI